MNAVDLENYRMCLADAWTLDEPIKNLCVCIKHLCAIANAGGEALSDRSCCCAADSFCVGTGQCLYPLASIQTWRRDHANTDRTWAIFCPHFVHSDTAQT